MKIAGSLLGERKRESFFHPLRGVAFLFGICVFPEDAWAAACLGTYVHVDGRVCVINYYEEHPEIGCDKLECLEDESAAETTL